MAVGIAPLRVPLVANGGVMRTRVKHMCARQSGTSAADMRETRAANLYEDGAAETQYLHITAGSEETSGGLDQDAKMAPMSYDEVRGA